jgi:integrating conjugative element protein (TIGR03757 family)
MDRPQLIESSIAYSRAARCLLATIVFSIITPTADATSFYLPVRVEVFTTTVFRVAAESAIGTKEPNQDIDLQFYELNGIQLVEAELSKDLSDDPGQSKQVALQRIQALGKQMQARLARSAEGLAKAMQYGIDRYPVIVFDGQAVVYGVTELKAALAHYRTWRTGAQP